MSVIYSSLVTRLAGEVSCRLVRSCDQSGVRGLTATLDVVSEILFREFLILIMSQLGSEG